MKKPEQVVEMERASLAAVIHMGCESLSPDDFYELVRVTKQIAETRNLGNEPLVYYLSNSSARVVGSSS